MPPPTLQVTLDPDAQAELERRYHTTHDPRTAPATRWSGWQRPGNTRPRSPNSSAAAPVPSAGSSTASGTAGPTPCRAGPPPASRPTTRPAGWPSWSGSPSWTRTEVGVPSAVDDRLLADYLAGVTGHRRRSRRPDRPAPRRVCVQAAPLGAVAQGPGPAGVGKKRLRVEALLAAAASSAPPPAGDLVPDATLAGDLFPEDLPRLLGLLGRRICTCRTRSRSPCTRP